MASVTLRNVSFSLGGRALLDQVDLQLERGERICLVGRNGEGKSTLLRLIAGQLAPDDGALEVLPGTRIGWLEQAVPRDLRGTAFDVVADGLGPAGSSIAAHHRASLRLAHGEDDDALHGELERLEAAVHEHGDWGLFQRVEETLSRLSLTPDEEVAELSAGMKRRVLLGRALVSDPDVLLLDEPTNHLDIRAIQTIEGLLLRSSATLLFVSHDRAFLTRLATRIVELDRGRLTCWACGYAKYVERRQAALEAEEANAALHDKRLAAEEAWLRRGVKARRARNEGRVRALLQMREARQARRARAGRVRTAVQEAERSGRLVVEAKGVGFAYGEEPVFEGFDCTIMRGDRIGILGPNGAGKTTLLRVLLGEAEPSTGTIRLGTNLEIAYFDQLHAQLDEDRSVIHNVSGGVETVHVGGRARHIHGYLSDFLFSPERARSAVRELSGGERNRVLLARLLTRPANLLVLDEPTNDLDIETLEVLEELLTAFKGTLLLVSHDRAFLDNVVTSTLVLEGDGRVKELEGGFEAYLRWRRAEDEAALARKAASAAASAPKTAQARRLTWKEKRELEALPERLEALEAEQNAMHEAMAARGFYEQGGEAIAAATSGLKTLEAELVAAYARWEELEALA